MSVTPDPDVETHEGGEPSVEPAPARAARGRARWSRRLGTVMRSRFTRLGFLAVVVGLLVVALLDEGGAMWDDIQRLSAFVLVLAFVGNVAALVCAMMVWREVLVDLGSRLSLLDAWRINFIAQLGKYLPGKLWQVVAQAELSRDAGVPVDRSAMASLLAIAVMVVTGGIVGGATLPFEVSGSSAQYLWFLLVVPLGLIVLSPPVMNRLLTFALKLLKRPPLGKGVSLRGLLRATAWSIVLWLCYGVSTFVLLHQLGDHRPDTFVIATGAYALSWTVGFLALVAPAGIGAREAVLVAILGSRTTAGTALAVALSTRGLAVAADGLTGLSAVTLVGRGRLRRLRAAPTAPTAPTSGGAASA